MSSEYDQYFQEFLGDDSNQFDIFKGDSSGEPEDNEDWQLPDGGVSSSDLPPPAPTFDSASPALVGDTLLPDTDARSGVRPCYHVKIGSLNLQSPNMASPSPCNWLACATRFVARTETEIAAHLESHWKDTHRQWAGPRRCIWKDCPSKSTFKSPGAFKSHIFNIHVSPLVCTYPECTYGKPFGKKCDLDRHVATTHAASSTHVCPVESCDANTNGFARKDKLLNHIREEHDNLRCPYNHCYAIVLATEQDAHLQEVHGSFECALGACEHGPASCFSEVGLKRHFRKHHNMTIDPANTLMRKVKDTMDKTAQSPHIAKLRKWKDCPPCSEAQIVSASAPNGDDVWAQNGDISQG